MPDAALPKAELVPNGPAVEGMIFDLDGTLADTVPVSFAAFRAAAARFGARQFTDEELLGFFGPSEDGIFQRLLPDQWQRCFEHYLDEYAGRHTRDASIVFPGIKPALARLAARGILLGVVTGKASRAAAITLAHCDLARFFDVVEAGSAEGGIKAGSIQKVLNRWGVQGRCVAYVGDMPGDMRVAQKVGLAGIGAAWSALANAAELQAAGAAATFTTVATFARWSEAHARKPGGTG